jgi:prepilin-type N-terminal cleavage/methylation domain-containing protein
MKLTNIQKMKSKPGMTLLELTVVILVLLSLISILFIGARAWKKGSDRSANILNLRNTQQSMRGHQNMRELAVGGDFTATQLADYMKMPTGVATVTYSTLGKVTATGTLWLVASADGLAGAEYGHTAATDYSEW